MRYQIRDLNTGEVILSSLHGTVMEIIRRYELATKENSHLQLEGVTEE